MAFLTFALSEVAACVSAEMGGGGGVNVSLLKLSDPVVVVVAELSDELLQESITVARTVIITIFFMVFFLSFIMPL
jgi:hypothetical protein